MGEGQGMAVDCCLDDHGLPIEGSKDQDRQEDRWTVSSAGKEAVKWGETVQFYHFLFVVKVQLFHYILMQKLRNKTKKKINPNTGSSLGNH